MFLCPISSTKLRSAFVRGVNVWYSPDNGGRLVNLAVVRKVLGPDLATEMWVRSGLKTTLSCWKKCPSCSHNMKIVNAPQWAGGYEVNVCRNCYLLWLDKNDFPEIPTPDDMIFPIGDATIVSSMVEQISYNYQAQDKKDNPDIIGPGPESMWKSIPGFMGLPVEMEDDRKNGLGWATWVIAFSMLMVHIFLTTKNPSFIKEWSLLPIDFFRHAGLTTITWGFIHADWAHLISNLYFFGVFADDVEVYYGKRKFLYLIFGCLFFSAFTTYVIYKNPSTPHIGLSGVICAIMINYGLIYRKSRIAFFMPYMHSLTNGSYTRIFGWIRISAIWVIVGYMIKDLILYFIFELNHFSYVSYSGHIIGATFGFIFWLLNGCPNWYYDSVNSTFGTIKERMISTYK